MALACLALIAIVSWLTLAGLSENAARVAQTHQVSNGLDRLLLATTETETAMRGYILSGETLYLDSFSEAVGIVDATFRGLEGLAAHNELQQQRLRAMRKAIDERLTLSADRIELRRTQGLDAVVALAPQGAGRRLQENLREQIVQAKALQTDLLKEHEARTRRSTTLTKMVIVGSALLALAIVAWSMLIIRRDLAARRAAEAQLDRFFSLSLDFLCISSSDGYFKRVSPAVTEVLGWSVAEFLARPYMAFVHPDDAQATVREVEKQLVDGDKVLRFENRYRHSNGTWRVLSWRSTPQPDGLMYATARDVTERKEQEASLLQAKDELELRVGERTAELAQANESLRRSERRFRALIEHGGDAMTLIDSDNKVLYLSPAVAAVEGYTPEELVGQPGIREVHPDDEPKIEALKKTLEAHPGQPVPLIWRRRHKLGHWIWLEGVSTNLLHDPDVRAVVANYRNVTERKQAEGRLQAQLARLALLSEITHAISEHQDTHSIFQIVVHSIETQLPVDFACLCIYQPHTNSLSVNNVGAVHPELTRQLSLEDGANIQIEENGLSHCVRGALVYEPDLDDTTTSFARRLTLAGLHAMVAAPLTIEGTVFGVLIAARTTTHSFSSAECEFLQQLSAHVALATHQSQLHTSLQLAYEELRQTQQSVMQQERMRVLGQMASGIAHDINNAISPISLYTESLLERENGLSEHGRGQLQTIRRAIEDVAETVGRMREFYRQREATLTSAPLQLNVLVPQVVELTRARWSDMPQARGTVIELRTEVASDLPSLSGVESEIREALTNLVFNAVDAMPNGGVLTIRTAIDVSVSQQTQRVRLEVIDTGTGMTEETRRRCLELFFTTKGERGTGLGLAMVYGIVQRHNGDIEIHSVPGEGTRVSLSFPAVIAASAPVAVATRIVPAGLRVLVVDDDTIILESMQLVPSNDGFIVVTAAGGQQGIDEFKKAQTAGTPFDLVITDLGMPVIDGRRVAGAIKAASPVTPVLLLTGWGQRMVSDGETPPNVDLVLSKPPRPKDLRAAIADLIPTSHLPALP